jgi:hypothetical protein
VTAIAEEEEEEEEEEEGAPPGASALAEQHVAAVSVTAPGDAAGAIHLHPVPQLVGEPAPVGGTRLHQVGQSVRQWTVVVTHPGVKPATHDPLDRLRGNPGHRGN